MSRTHLSCQSSEACLYPKASKMKYLRTSRPRRLRRTGTNCKLQSFKTKTKSKGDCRSWPASKNCLRKSRTNQMRRRSRDPRSLHLPVLKTSQRKQMAWKTLLWRSRAKFSQQTPGYKLYKGLQRTRKVLKMIQEAGRECNRRKRSAFNSQSQVEKTCLSLAKTIRRSPIRLYIQTHLLLNQLKPSLASTFHLMYLTSLKPQRTPKKCLQTH